jgi:hypothetical protein
MQKVKNFLAKNIWLVIIFLSAPAVWSLFVPGLYGFSDDSHIGWLYEMDRAIKLWQIPPRFVPDLSFGFGYPLFTFVYPLPFYIGEIFHLIGFSLVDALKIVFGLTIPLSMGAMYLLLREYLDQRLALAGAVLYIFAPYRATEIFVRGAIGEIVAFIFIPLITLSIIKLTQKDSGLKWVGIAGLSIAALIMSHNILSYMFLPFAFGLLILRIIFLKAFRLAYLLKYFLGILLGLLISSFFWLPAIAESSLVKFSTVYNYYDHFPTLRQLITPYFGYGASVPGPYDGISFYVGIMGLGVIVLGSILAFKNWKQFSKSEKVLFIWGALVLLASVFMMNHRSDILWRSLPLVGYFQFPWRFLVLVVFSAPVFLLGFTKIKYKGIISLLIIVGAIGLNFLYFKPQSFLGRTDDYFIDRYIPFPEASEEYRRTSEEYLRLPKDTEVRPERNYPRAYAEVRANLSVQEVNALDAVITTDYPVEFTLNYNKYYFPGWVAKIDGEKVQIEAGKPFGQVSISVPGGTHEVVVEYRETPFRMFLNIASLASLGIAIHLATRKVK